MLVLRRSLVVGIALVALTLGVAPRLATSAGAVVTVDAAVAKSSDDAEESPAGAVSLTSSDLELVDDDGSQVVGMRFPAVAVPRGAAVVEAYVQFEVDKASSDPTLLVVQGQASGDAPTFTTATRNVSQRLRTSTSASWSPPPWTVVQARGPDQRTPDLSAVVGEIVARPDWTSGNAIVVIVSGTGERIAESYNGVAPPVLHVAYASDAPPTTTTPTTTSSPPATTTPPATTSPPATTTPTTTLPVERDGSFRAVCKLSHQAQVDPIVAPGGVSHHRHDFFGSRTTSAISTYESMVASATSCTNPLDPAGYWAPSLVSPTGTIVKPTQGVFYYRNRPVEYGSTVAFPPDFRMIAGGADAFPNSYWTCDGESDTALATRKSTIPNCGARGKIKLHVFFPPCWDGQRIDSPDHRSHVAYGLNDGVVDGTDPDECPASHPVKLPQLDFRVLYPVGNGTGYRLADGEVLAHSDFWNTWRQPELERLVQQCLRGGLSCGAA